MESPDEIERARLAIGRCRLAAERATLSLERARRALADIRADLEQRQVQAEAALGAMATGRSLPGGPERPRADSEPG
jgi:hypothetical protein